MSYFLLYFNESLAFYKSIIIQQENSLLHAYSHSLIQQLFFMSLSLERHFVEGYENKNNFFPIGLAEKIKR